MIRIRRKKEKEDIKAPEAEKPIADDSAFVGAYPGKPWEKLTHVRPGKGSRIKTLEAEEQAEVLKLARKYFDFTGHDFPGARKSIQNHLDKCDQLAENFFGSAIFTEKRLIVRAYLSNAEGRHVSHDISLKLLKYIADAGLDFEVGAIDYFFENGLKTEFVVGDGTEVVSENGYWFAHTHPVKAGITSNLLPSTQDLDVMLLTARAYAQHHDIFETEYFVLRDIGHTKVTIETSMKQRPSQPEIIGISIDYACKNEPDQTVNDHINKLIFHLRTRHRLGADQITLNKLESSIK